MRAMPDWISRELARLAMPTCPECHGEGVVTYTARNIHGETEVACKCVEQAMMKVSR